MTNLKKDLKTLQKEITALEKKMERLIAAAEKSKKSKAAKKATTKSVKAKATKRTTAKKSLVKKKIAPPTATDQVLKILKGRKRGVDAATLVKKTGFDLKKVRNILARTYKMGKIKRVGKGIYIGG